MTLTIVRRLALGACLAVLASWAAGRLLSDRFAWSQWLLWIPTPAALTAAALGTLAAWLRGGARRSAAAWLGCAIVVTLYFAVVEHRFLRSRPAPAPGLRLVHGNVLPVGRLARESFAETLVELDADLTVLSSPLSSDRLRELADRLGFPEHIVTLWPFMAICKVPLLEARQLVANADVRIAMLRVQPESMSRPLTVYLIDLPSSPGVSRIHVARTARRLLDRTGAPPPDVVVGDFNMTRGGAALHELFPELQHAYDQAGRGYGATYPRAFPLYHIDHALLGPTVRATRYDLVDPGTGRHRIQVVDLATGEN